MSKNDKTDSVSHTEDRRARIRAESERLTREAEAADAERAARAAVQDAKSNEEDAATLERHAQLVSNEETRDQLLDRVRKMRETTPTFVNAPLGKSAFALEQQKIEEDAGRQAVARAEKQMEETRKAREAAATAESKAREGHMTPVHQPNPGQDEQFPTTGATLGKKK